MRRFHLKLFMAVSLLISAFAFGVRGGERVESSPFQRSGLGLIVILAVHGLVLAPTKRRAPGDGSSWVVRQAAPRLVGAGLILVVGAGGWGVGAHLGRKAFHDCLERGEEVRAALSLHQAQTGDFPESLAELDLARVGRRWLNADLLEYRTEGTGYVLSFRDRFVEHRASESETFVASK